MSRYPALARVYLFLCVLTSLASVLLVPWSCRDFIASGVFLALGFMLCSKGRIFFKCMFFISFLLPLLPVLNEVLSCSPCRRPLICGGRHMALLDTLSRGQKLVESIPAQGHRKAEHRKL